MSGKAPLVTPPYFAVIFDILLIDSSCINKLKSMIHSGRTHTYNVHVHVVRVHLCESKEMRWECVSDASFSEL